MKKPFLKKSAPPSEPTIVDMKVVPDPDAPGETTTKLMNWRERVGQKMRDEARLLKELGPEKYAALLQWRGQMSKVRGIKSFRDWVNQESPPWLRELSQRGDRLVLRAMGIDLDAYLPTIDGTAEDITPRHKNHAEGLHERPGSKSGREK